MRAADLIVAKSVLAQDHSPVGALPVFFESHLDAAREQSEDLSKKVKELDEIDLQGWLSRLLLQEYMLLGDLLHPSEPEADCTPDTEEFARWVHGLAARAPGAESVSLDYRGRYFRVAIIFVALADRLANEGLRPYRRRAKRYIWKGRFDAVYLMARDQHIWAVEALADEMEGDVRVASVSRYRYSLGEAFKKRHKLDRDEAIIVCLRRRRAPGEEAFSPELDEDEQEADELPEESYEAESAPPEVTDRTKEAVELRVTKQGREASSRASRQARSRRT